MVVDDVWLYFLIRAICIHHTRAVCIHHTRAVCVHRTRAVCVHRTRAVCVHCACCFRTYTTTSQSTRQELLWLFFLQQRNASNPILPSTGLMPPTTNFKGFWLKKSAPTYVWVFW